MHIYVTTQFFATQRFKLDGKLEVDQRILKSENLRYSPSEMSTTNTASSHFNIFIPGEVSVISFMNNYLDLQFDILRNDNNDRYVDGANIGLVNLGPNSLFSN